MANHVALALAGIIAGQAQFVHVTADLAAMQDQGCALGDEQVGPQVPDARRDMIDGGVGHGRLEVAQVGADGTHDHPTLGIGVTVVERVDPVEAEQGAAIAWEHG